MKAFVHGMATVKAGQRVSLVEDQVLFPVTLSGSVSSPEGESGTQLSHTPPGHTSTMTGFALYTGLVSLHCFAGTLLPSPVFSIFWAQSRYSNSVYCSLAVSVAASPSLMEKKN